ncbi:glycosyltransferase family 9 protein [Acidisoma sp. C75]
MAQQTTVTTILNGFGLSLGDGIIGLQALSAARTLGHITGRVVLGRREPPEKPLVPQLYGLIDDLAKVMPMEEAPRAGRLIDIRDFAFDPRFARVSMIDFFLARLGIAPESVPADLKRNRWLAPRLPRLPGLGLPPAYVLLCPQASIALRDMPEVVHAAIAEQLTRRGAGPVVTQGEPLAGAIAAPWVSRIEELCALVAGARGIISTDTAILHLADAFDVPCLAFFTTHRPEWRVRDYPRCLPLHLPAPGLPESIEFLRGPEDLAAARAAWFPAGDDLGWLSRALDQFLESVAAPGA